jgi:hypothetical protein
VEEQAVTAEAVTQPSDRGVRDAALAGDLAQAGAGNETVEDRLQEVGPSQPIAGRKGL